MDHLKYIAELDLADDAARKQLLPVHVFFAKFYASLDSTLRVLAAAYFQEGEESGQVVSRVHGTLTSRIADDLRVLWLATERGLVAQALAVNSSAMEGALTAARIGGDTAAAIRWLEWKDTKHAPYSAKQLYETLHRLDHGSTVSDANGDEILYRWFCLGKHVNPIVQLQIAVATSTAGYVLRSMQVIPSGTATGIVLALDFGLTTVMRAMLQSVALTGVPGPDARPIESMQRVVEAQTEVFEALGPWYDDPQSGVA